MREMDDDVPSTTLPSGHFRQGHMRDLSSGWLRGGQVALLGSISTEVGTYLTSTRERRGKLVQVQQYRYTVAQTLAGTFKTVQLAVQGTVLA